MTPTTAPPKQPTLVHAHLSQLLHPHQDIRDRDNPEYREFFDRVVGDSKLRGQQVPILAYREGDKLRIIDGLTRYLAALLALLDTVMVLVYDEKPDPSALKLGQLLANSMRRDMGTLELAAVYADLIKMNGWNQSELARNVHVSPAHVAKVLAISTKLCEQVRVMVAKAEVSPRAAYAISRIADIPTQIDIAEKVRKGILCVEGAEAHVSNILDPVGKKPAERPLRLKADGIELTAKKPLADGLRVFADRLIAALKKLKAGDDPADLLFHFKSA